MGVIKRKNKDGEEETWYVDYCDPTGKRIMEAVGPKIEYVKLKLKMETKWRQLPKKDG